MNVGRGYTKLEEWSREWVTRITRLFHLNRKRRQAVGRRASFAYHHRKLRKAIAEMVTQLEADLARPDLHPAQKKVLTSLQNHWAGLTLFVEDPAIPMDNNQAERDLRNAVLGRKSFYGSGAVLSTASGFSPGKQDFVEAGSRGVNFYLTAGSTLAGQVTDAAGWGVGGATIKAYQQTGKPGQTANLRDAIAMAMRGAVDQVRSGGDGHFEFTTLVAGDYSLVVVAKRGYQDALAEVSLRPGGGRLRADPARRGPDPRGYGRRSGRRRGSGGHGQGALAGCGLRASGVDHPRPGQRGSDRPVRQVRLL